MSERRDDPDPGQPEGALEPHLESIYNRRFAGDEEFRDRMYQALCSEFFQRYVAPDAVVLDVAAGNCEFINNIRAGRKLAVDINPGSARSAGQGVEWARARSSAMGHVKDGMVDVAFASNLFEHLTKLEIVRTIEEVRRVLKPGGRFLILQPNIRYCYRDYWMFFDHITPLDDRSLCEVLEVHGFRVSECRPRFLPYTTKSRLPKSVFLLKLYLRLPLAQALFGQQAFVCADKA